MNMLGLDMNDNIKGRTASVRIVANFGSQILHLPRFLTPLAISRKFHTSPLRGFLCIPHHLECVPDGRVSVLAAVVVA